MLTDNFVFSDNSQDQDGPGGSSRMFEDEPEEKIIPREGTIVNPRPDGRPPEPPEGFTIYTTESGVMVLRRKRQRNLHKLGELPYCTRKRFYVQKPVKI